MTDPAPLTADELHQLIWEFCATNKSKAIENLIKLEAGDETGADWMIEVFTSWGIEPSAAIEFSRSQARTVLLHIATGIGLMEAISGAMLFVFQSGYLAALEVETRRQGGTQ